VNALTSEIFIINDRHRNFLSVANNFRILFIPNARCIINPLFELSVAVVFIVGLFAQYKFFVGQI
jgi:hypothetical protein